MEVVTKTFDSILVKCHNIDVESFKYGELVILVDSDYDNASSCGYSECENEDSDGETGDIANEASVEDVLEIVRQATIAKKEPTIYEIEFGNVSDSSGKCSFDEMIVFLHKLGMSPTESQKEQLRNEFGTSNIDLESALRAYNETSTDKYTQQELLVSLDSTSPNINRKRLLLILQAFGDKMTEDEICRALDKLNIGDEPIEKEEFIERLCAGSKQIRNRNQTANNTSTNENLDGTLGEDGANNVQEHSRSEVIESSDVN
ncbi:myosin regulatory light chain [Cryptosporidium felis]|nr:myosin regulatory light chain [Cryptosporidium felis]